MLRVMDLLGWPPIPGGARSEGERSPTSLDQVTIEAVTSVMLDHVNFTCMFHERPVSYSFPVPDKNTGEKVANILNDNRKGTLLSVATLEVPNN